MIENELSEDQVRALFDACQPVWEKMPDDMVGKVWAGGPILKPCPFCGSKNIEILQDKDNHDGHKLWLIRHWDDKCVLYGNTMRYDSKKELIEDWNRRVKE